MNADQEAEEMKQPSAEKPMERTFSEVPPYQPLSDLSIEGTRVTTRQNLRSKAAPGM